MKNTRMFAAVAAVIGAVCLAVEPFPRQTAYVNALKGVQRDGRSVKRSSAGWRQNQRKATKARNRAASR